MLNILSSIFFVNKLYTIISLLPIEKNYYGKCKNFWSKLDDVVKKLYPPRKNPGDASIYSRMSNAFTAIDKKEYLACVQKVDRMKLV